jgi:hypothetical protein
MLVKMLWLASVAFSAIHPAMAPMISIDKKPTQVTHQVAPRRRHAAI